MDDCSRASWLYLLHHKSATSSLLSNFFTYIKTQFHGVVKVIRTDNGLEFCNKKCLELFTSLGIIHQTSCVYTPPQNGRVERKHRHLIQVSRSLLLTSVPKIYWGNAMLHAAYLINRLPTQVLKWKSPCEILFKSTPDLSNLHVFGCLCFVKVSCPVGKLDAQGLKGVFLGVASDKKSYKVLVLSTKRLSFLEMWFFMTIYFPQASKVICFRYCFG